MFQRVSISVAFFVLLAACSTSTNKEAATAEERAPVKCMENSPERRGQEGCSILANRPLTGSPATALYWHIDRFDSLEAALKAAGPNGVAAEAHGSVWLMTVEATPADHHGGQHVASIGPFSLPPADRYTMRVLSSSLYTGSRTPIHTHSGPEIFYIVDGEQCIEQEAGAQRLGAGKWYIIPGSTVHRGRVLGAAARRALALIVYDAAQPPSHDLDNPPPLVACP